VSRHRIRFTLNDAPVEADVPAERLLLELLREDLGKTGTKDGCSVGVCGLPLQEAFIEEGGFQCGICTSGQLMAADALLRAKPAATTAEISDWQMGNLCRCTGYYGIARAIAKARDAR